MEYVALGRSNLLVSRTSFGASGLGSAGSDDIAVSLVRAAYEGGVNFFDTSHVFPESERRLGQALYGIRQDVILATKTASCTGSGVFSDFAASLENLQTDMIDLYQTEASSFMPAAGGADEIYDALAGLKKEGRIRSIGIATESMEIAVQAVESGLYDVLQFPFNMLLPQATVSIVDLCEKNDVGFIAMKPLCGGLVMNLPLAFGFIRQYENVVPVWGIKTAHELEQILFFEARPPSVDSGFMEDVTQIRNFFS